MLYIDGILLHKYIKELNENYTNTKLRKINQHDKFSFSFQINRHNLYISINPSLPILYTKISKDETFDKPQQFLLSLRKYLQGSILKKVDQAGFDRIVYLHFNKINELGEEKDYILIFEMMGKHSNLILCEHNFEIIDILKRFSLEENRLRLLMPNVFYKKPIIENKKDPVTIDNSKFEDIVNEPFDIIRNIEGFGKISANYCENYKKFEFLVNSPPSPVIYFKDGKIDLGIFTDIFPNREKKKFKTINEMIRYYIHNTIKSQQFNNLATNMKKILNSEISKYNKILNNVEKDINKNSNYEKIKMTGDILAANQYDIKLGDSSKEFFDFYNNKMVTVNLNPEISASQNIDRYYKKYNKKKRGYEFSLNRKKEIFNEIMYLESILVSIENCDNYNELLEIKKELVENDLMRSSKKRNKKKQSKTFTPREFISSEGYKIIVGKNNVENDILTFEIASKDDMWLHAKNIPGSHVIIVSPNGYPDKTIEEAAAIAAYYSKARNEKSVMVDYTFKRYVNKPKKGKPGFVTYRNEKSVYIKPELIKQGEKDGI